ncbi:hypothetical protein SAMN02746066_03168 [Anaerosporobacter mobilis DSM 15930]|uniref:DUF4350 domain-containing protein n=1 Tax=Anaerosporobacter mobilis DSM 15930 TaxID=1120996 RepID=A0A1M7LC53_9FIRM|nr:hypothetical protein [Anaerosporobacter mobilis]SHM75547.1 hypothetical protein SAMN02746066_03168 [Anaerosporobacter mobilis DSM 15930]
MVSSMKRYSLLLCIIVLLLTGCSVFTRKESTTNTSDNRSYNYPVVFTDVTKEVRVKVSYGLNQYAKIGKDMHLKVEITTGKEPYEGYLQIEVPFESSSTKYNQDIAVASDSYATYEMNIPVAYENMKFLINLLDNEKKTQASQKANVQASRIYDVQYIGVFNKKMQTEPVVSQGKMQVFQLYADKLEDAFDNLNLIDCILINEDEIKKLDESVALRLKEWLQNGGTLLVEDTYKKVISREEETGKDSDNTGDYGFGRYIFVPEMENVSELTRYVESLGLNPKLFLSGITDNQIKASINAEVVSKIPSFTKYVILFLLYIIVIGPVLYGILKMINRRTYYWGIAPAISVIFLACVYGLGKETRVENTYLRYVTITQIAQNGYTNDTTYSAAVSPAKATLSVQADEAENLRPLYTMRDNYQVSSDKKRANMEFSMNVENTTDEEKLGSLSTISTVTNLRAFQPIYLKTTKSYQTSEKEGQEMQPATRLTYANYSMTGTFTNTLGVDMRNACIVSNQTLIKIGDLSSGEAVELEDCQQEYIPSYDLIFTEAVDSRIKDLTKSTDTMVDKDTYIEENSRYTLMQYLLNEWVVSNPDGSYLIAFTEDSDENSVVSKLGISQVEAGAHLIIKELGIDYAIGNGDIFQPTIKKYMTVVDGDYYEALDMIESDNLTVDYNFGRERIKRIEYSSYYNTEFYVDETNKEDLWLGFYGSIYFYNRRTGEYDKVITSGEETVMNQLKDYLDDTNVLRVRYEVSQNSVNSNLITIPKLTAIVKKK